MILMSTRTKTLLLLLGGVAMVLIVFYSNQIMSGATYDPSGSFLRSPASALTRRFFSSYQWKREFGELNGPDVNPSDAKVISKLKSRYLISPSVLPYNLSHAEVSDPSMGQAQKIRTILGPNMRNGFFVECGALDGETRSNTLYFEKELGWEGLLLEADPSNFAQVIWKQRKAWISPACLSVKNYPTMVSFEQKANEGRISSYGVGYMQKGFVDIQCFPLYSFMLAMNRSRIDYFSLDVEGLELEVLKTIPFDKLHISTLSVEFIHGKEGKEVMRKFMDDKGYYVHSEVTHPDWLANDFIFVRKDLPFH